MRNQLASGSADGMCRVWSVEEVQESDWYSESITEVSLKTAIMPHSSVEGERNKDVTSLSWSPDGMFLATGCYDGTGRIWSFDGALVMTLKAHVGPVYSMKWSASGTYLLSGSFDTKAIVWLARTGEIIKAYANHSDPVMDVDWMDDDVFVTCSIDK